MRLSFFHIYLFSFAIERRKQRMSSSRSARMRSDSYSHPRIRRLSRRELEEIFPTNNQPRSSIKSFPSNQTSKQYLTNLNSCRISSDQAKLSFDQRLEQEQINARSKSKARQSYNYVLNEIELIYEKFLLISIIENKHFVFGV